MHLWWCGFGFVAGLATAHLFLRLWRGKLGMSLRSVYALSLLVAVLVITGGRLVEVVLYEWPYYSAHPTHIPGCG